MRLKKIIKFFTNFIIIFIITLSLDLLINLILSEKFKKSIGTSRNYSLRSERFHHETASNINVYEYWGKKKYRIKTNKYSMRSQEDEVFKIDELKKNIGFIGDSFVYGSGIEYKKHFISLVKNNNDNYNYFNMGYVSYSPSIYFKKLKFFIEEKKLNFDKIYIFIDHSDIQDEGIFYREDYKGNIVRKWLSDKEVKKKNFKYLFKNYLKQNSFLFKFSENFNTPKISKKSNNCLSSSDQNYDKYIDKERFGYSYNLDMQKKEWVVNGINKTQTYLDKINNLSKKYNFEINIVTYPSALEVIEKILPKESQHFIFLKNWSIKNNVNLINTNNDFLINNGLDGYLVNFIKCDVHWNDKGHEIIGKNILSNLTNVE